MIRISYKKIRKIVFIILALPFLVFSLGWLKWYWAATVCLGVSFAVLYGCFGISGKKKCKDTEESISIPIKIFVFILLVGLLWVWQSGIGGMWAQSEDFPYRNAIFRDLVLRDWPVIYPKTGHALVYYIGYWMVPALFGKFALLLGFSEDTSFRIADGALFVWSVLLILLVFLLIFVTLKINDSKKQIFVIFLFVFFSGMDIWGNVGYSLDSLNYHLEWWAHDYQYSSFSTCLFWVFNQAVPAWLCMLCIINEKTAKNYVFIGMMCLFCAPIPFIGLFVYCIFLAIRFGIRHFKEKHIKEYIKDILSPSNIVSGILIFPIIATYVLSNYAIQGGGTFRISETLKTPEILEEGIAVEGTTAPFSENPLVNYISFILIEFGLYMVLMAWKYKKNGIYYMTAGCLFIIPLLKIGGNKDFAMRASIPALMVVFLLVCRFLIEEKAVLKMKGSLQRLTYILLCIFLLLGCLTPAVEFYRGIKNVSGYGIRNDEKYDNIYTLGCDGPYDNETSLIYSNFVSVNLEDQTFFKVFCRKP